MPCVFEFDQLNPEVCPVELENRIDRDVWRSLVKLLKDKHELGAAWGCCWGVTWSIVLFPFGLLCFIVSPGIARSASDSGCQEICRHFNRSHDNRVVFKFQHNRLHVYTEHIIGAQPVYNQAVLASAVVIQPIQQQQAAGYAGQQIVYTTQQQQQPVYATAPAQGQTQQQQQMPGGYAYNIPVNPNQGQTGDVKIVMATAAYVPENTSNDPPPPPAQG